MQQIGSEPSSLATCVGLPVEVWSLILSFLRNRAISKYHQRKLEFFNTNYTVGLRRVAMASKASHQVSWSAIRRLTFDSDHPRKFISLARNQKVQARSLRLFQFLARPGPDGVPPERDLLPLLQRSPNLEELEFQDNIVYVDLVRLFLHQQPQYPDPPLPEGKLISLGALQFSGANLKVFRITAFRIMGLREGQMATRFITYVAQTCPSLVELSAEGFLLESPALEAIATHCTKLEILRFYPREVDWKELRPLAHLKRLIVTGNHTQYYDCTSNGWRKSIARLQEVNPPGLEWWNVWFYNPEEPGPSTLLSEAARLPTHQLIGIMSEILDAIGPGKEIDVPCQDHFGLAIPIVHLAIQKHWRCPELLRLVGEKGCNPLRRHPTTGESAITAMLLELHDKRIIDYYLDEILPIWLHKSGKTAREVLATRGLPILHHLAWNHHFQVPEWGEINVELIAAEERRRRLGVSLDELAHDGSTAAHRSTLAPMLLKLGVSWQTRNLAGENVLQSLAAAGHSRALALLWPTLSDAEIIEEFTLLPFITISASLHSAEFLFRFFDLLPRHPQGEELITRAIHVVARMTSVYSFVPFFADLAEVRLHSLENNGTNLVLDALCLNLDVSGECIPRADPKLLKLPLLHALVLGPSATDFGDTLGIIHRHLKRSPADFRAFILTTFRTFDPRGLDLLEFIEENKDTIKIGADRLEEILTRHHLR